MRQRRKEKTHFTRKIIAVILTVLVFVMTASFSSTATATVMDSDVIFVNKDGSRVAVDKSELLNAEEALKDMSQENVSLEDDELDKIAETSKRAAEDFNKRKASGSGDSSHNITIVDRDGRSYTPSFDEDWALILINKDHPIPDDYTFELATITGSVKVDVRAAESLVEMIKQARSEGIGLYVASPYRDLERQTYVFNRKKQYYLDMGYDEKQAYDLAAETVAPPGTSEHQVGMAVDLIASGYKDLDEGFAYTEGGRWLAKHGPEYGWLLRYPKGKEDITGIEFEPWHYRYVGVDAAKEITRLGITLEEYDEMIGLVDSDE